MSGPNKYQFQEDVIKCPLCTKHYNIPRILPCLHTFCSDCLAKHIQESLQKAPEDHGDKLNSKTTITSPVRKGTNQNVPHGPNHLKLPNTGAAGPKGPNTKKQLQTTNGAQRSNSNIKGSLEPEAKKGDASPIHQSSSLKTAPSQSGLKSPNENASVTTVGKSKQQHESANNNIGSQGQKSPTVDLITKVPHDGALQQTRVKGFSCPCCKKFATTPKLPTTTPDKWSEMFPENIMIADLVDLHTLKLGTRLCDPCKRNKISSQVNSYCKNCRDALCESCAKTHRGLRSCKNHKVLATSEFAEAINLLKVEEDLCKQHDGKAIEHYCYTHNILCCSQCITENHRKCERVTPVEEIVKTSREKNEIGTLHNAINKYKGYVDLILKDRSSLIKQLENKKSKLMEEFVNVKNHIISQLEKMDKDLKKILDSTHRSETKKIKTETDKFRELLSALVNTNEMLVVADHHGSNSQLIEMIEKIKAECEYYEESMSIFGSRMRIVDYDIALDTSLQQVINRLNQFGRIDVNTTPSKLPPAPKLAATLGLQSATTKMKAVKPKYTLDGKHANEIGEFCARFVEDMQDCWFTGARFLFDGRILLADRTNRKLKLFTSNFQPVQELQLSSKPWDLTQISDKEVAVTLPAECRIQFVSIEASCISQSRSISTDEPCFGVCYADGKILTVTYDGDPPNLKILSLTGKELTYVSVDDDGFALFSKPVYVACNPKADQIFVSDERMGCVVNLKESGELNFNYSALDLGHAAGITLDADGNIYVCGNTSNSVHVLSPSGEKVKVLVTGDSISYPRAVAFEPREMKLLVTQGDKDIVKVYSLA